MLRPRTCPTANQKRDGVRDRATPQGHAFASATSRLNSISTLARPLSFWNSVAVTPLKAYISSSTHPISTWASRCAILEQSQARLRLTVGFGTCVGGAIQDSRGGQDPPFKECGLLESLDLQIMESDSGIKEEEATSLVEDLKNLNRLRLVLINAGQTPLLTLRTLLSALQHGPYLEEATL